MGIFGSNPAKAAMPYLQQIPQFGKDAYQPFINQGMGAMSGQPNYQEMAQNPTNFLNMLMGQYQPSAGYQHKLDNALKAGGAAGAAGGVAGTPYHQEHMMGLANSLLDQDMQQFLGNVLGIQGFGAQGLENQIGRGFNASGNLADYLGSAYGQMGQAAFGGQQSSNATRQALLKGLIQAGAMGAGALAGGPAGAAIGGQLGGMIGGGGTGGGAGDIAGASGYAIPGGGQEALFGGGRYGNPGGQFTSLTSLGR